MAIGPREVMRSDVDGGLSGPANPIPNKSIDCGCRQMPCPSLAKFATRRLFVGLLCWVGIVQAASQAYLYITSPTIARRFQFDPNLIDWILTVAEVTPGILGLLVAYWGDRIHRAAWTGALVLLQSAGFIALIIPHFTHSTRIIEEPENVTHMSIYAEDNPELCSSGLSRVMVEEDEPCYTTLGILVGAQILTGIANIAYYTLGISYLDDNTKKRHISALLGVVIAVKIIGLFLGYFLAWGCLRLDSKNLNVIESYREQIGAWWLGWPILAFFLAVPGLFISWLPRRLPSEVVEQAAASILDLAGRSSPGSIDTAELTKVGGTGYCTSLRRLFMNKILICNIFVAVFSITALINFVASENIFLESRYHVPRPSGMLLGFGDPLLSRLTVSILKPIIIAMVILISGMVIARARPRARSLTIYNIVALVLAATIIFALVFATCEKPPIAGERRRSIDLLKYCNKGCRCSKDADFRPVCDSKSTFTFYSPCHAGCKTVEYVDDVKIYGGCSCVEDLTGLGNMQAKDGPCGSSSCQLGWLLFELGTLVAYSLVASCIVSHILILLRCVYLQDKALAIGFWLAIISIFVYSFGKPAYREIANANCKHWGKGSTCHLHDADTLGDYLCYITAILLLLGAAFEILLCFFCQKLRLYEYPESEIPRSTELQEVQKAQVPLLNENAGPSNVGRDETDVEVNVVVIESPVLDLHEKTVIDNANEESTGQLKYGPLGPGDRRTTSTPQNSQRIEAINPKMQEAETDDELDSSSDEDGAPRKTNKNKLLGSSPYVAYKPLELDSDVESDLSSIGPRSRRRVRSGIFDDVPKDYGSLVTSSNKRPFPNPDHYEEPNSAIKTSMMLRMNPYRGKSLEDIETKGEGGFSRTNSFEFSNKDNKNDSFKSNEGDFNEVGIPVMGPLVASVLATSGNRQSGHELPQQVLLPRHQKHVSQERLDTIRSLLDSVDENRKHRLENETLPEEEDEDYPEIPPPIIGRPPSRGQSSSGFGSLLDVGDKHEPALTLLGLPSKINMKSPDGSSSSRTTSPPNTRPKGGPLSTAL